MSSEVDIAIVGAGAAGLFAAIACCGVIDESGRSKRRETSSPSGLRVALYDGSKRLGVKILISGGGRCNLTNRDASVLDFRTEAVPIVKSTLLAFPPESVTQFFESRGCELFDEPLGKVFPKSGKARDVLDVLENEVRQAPASIHLGSEIRDVEPIGELGFRLKIEGEDDVVARRVIIASGGKSVPKTGSRGFGYDLARRLGHDVIPELPALTPLLAEGPLIGLSGMTLPVSLSVMNADTSPEAASGAKFRPIDRAAGSTLITHHGLSGPAALDVSGAAGKALHKNQKIRIRADFWSLTQESSPWSEFLTHPKPPGASLSKDQLPRPMNFEQFQRDMEAFPSTSSWFTEVSRRIPRRLVEALTYAYQIDRTKPLSQFSSHAWSALYEALVHCDIKLSGTEGFKVAEVTSGGVNLRELHRRTLESRLLPGLFFCGEVLDATGRLGGFNFQWAWSSGFVAGRGASRSLSIE